LDRPGSLAQDGPPFHAWLIAQNGAALGFNGEGIRYLWPETSQRRSHNFWIRWKSGHGYRLIQRVRPLPVATTKDRRFNESSVDHMLKCLVTGVRIVPRSVCRRWLWLF